MTGLFWVGIVIMAVAITFAILGWVGKLGEKRISIALALTTIVITVIVTMIYPAIDDYRHYPFFALEYEEDGYSYLMTTTTTRVNGQVISESDDLTATLGMTYKIVNNTDKKPKNVSPEIYDYIVLERDDMVVKSIPIEDEFESKSSYSYVDNCYSFTRKPIHISYIVDEANKLFSESTNNIRASHISKVKVTYDTSSRTECKEVIPIYPLLQGSNMDLTRIIECESNDCQIEASKLDEDDEYDSYYDEVIRMVYDAGEACDDQQ